MNRDSTLAFDVYKNTLRRANGFRPVSGGRGYSKIVCRFRENDWATEGDLLSAGFYVTPKHVTGVSGTVVANTDDNAPETARLLAEFTIPTDILRQKLPFYFGIAGVYEEGNIVIATNTVRVDTARSIVVDELSGNEEIMSNYEMLMGVLNGKAAKTYVDAQDAALEQRVSSLESGKADAATTIAGYGITDAYTKAETDTALGDKANAADVYTKTDADDKFFTKTAANRKTNEADFVAFKHDVENRFELHLTVGFDENGVPVKWGDKGTYSGGDFADNRIVTAFVSSKVTRLFSGTFASCTNLTDIYIDKASGELTIDPCAIPSGATVYYKGEFNAVDLIIKALKWFETGKADKATTLAGYGITDAYTKTEMNTALGGKADKADTLAGYGIEDAYTKTETDTALGGKADTATTLAGYGITDAYTKAQADQVTDKNRAEVLGGDIVPQMERGSIRNTPTDYITAQSYIRTKQGFDMWLNPGAVIGLTSYTGARFKVWCTRPDGTYTQSGWLTAAYSVSEFGFYKIVMSHDPEEVLSDSDVEELAARLRVTNVGIAGYQEANALAPLILGLNGTAYINFSVNMDATPPTATMTIPPDTLLMTTQGAVQLSAQAVTVDFSAINSTAIQIVYNKNTGTVDVVNYQSHDRNHIPIAVLRRNLTDKRYTPLTVSINAPYRINGRWYNLPFSETLTPMILGNSAENYVSVDTKTHTITFPADTLLMVGGNSGYVSLNGGQAYTIDYSVANSTAVKLYYNTNTGTMFVTKFNDNYYCFYPLIAVMRVQRYDNDTVYPSVSIAAPVVIDGKPNGYSDPSRVNNALLKNINHRGYNTVAPENTLPAFRLSKKKGFAIVETDVQRTSDGVYVCLHDRKINRTARNSDGTEISGTVNIDEITYTQAAAYDFGIWKSDAYAGTKIPTLVQFVRLCRNIGLEMYIELKEETITTQAHVSEIVAIVKENGMLSHCTFISFLSSHLFQVLIAAPTARIGFLCNNAEFDNISTAKSLRGDTFSVDININTGTSTFNTTQKGDKNVFINLPCDVTGGDALSLAIEEDFPVEVWVVSQNAEPNFININPYVTGFTSNKELGSNVLYERYI